MSEMNNPERQRIFEALRDDHWRHLQSWKPVEDIIDKVAEHLKTDVQTLREVMRDVEKAYPKQPLKSRRTWKQVEFTKPCRTCGKVIGFARTETGKFMPVNLDDFSTHWSCDKPAKAERKTK